MPETLLHLFWGYTIIWLCIALYVLFIGKEQRRLHTRAETLMKELERLTSVGG